MAWGYWTAHTLIPSRSRPRSLSPGPVPIARSRDHSLDRPSIAKLCHTPESEPRCSSVGHSNHVSPGSHSREYHHHDHHDHHDHHRDRDTSDWSGDERPDKTKDRDGERNTLPRVKMESETGGVLEQRHTLPRARDHWSDHDQGGGGGEWCPGCGAVSSAAVSNVSSCR